jgi:hypothetical protein
VCRLISGVLGPKILLQWEWLVYWGSWWGHGPTGLLLFAYQYGSMCSPKPIGNPKLYHSAIFCTIWLIMALWASNHDLCTFGMIFFYSSLTPRSSMESGYLMHGQSPPRFAFAPLWWRSDIITRFPLELKFISNGSCVLMVKVLTSVLHVYSLGLKAPCKCKSFQKQNLHIR